MRRCRKGLHYYSTGFITCPQCKELAKKATSEKKREDYAAQRPDAKRQRKSRFHRNPTSNGAKRCQSGHFYPATRLGCHECHRLARLLKREFDNAIRIAQEMFNPIPPATIEMWICDRTFPVPPLSLLLNQCPKSGELYKDYCEWKMERRERPENVMIWATTMLQKFERVESNFVRYRGLILKPKEPTDVNEIC